MSTFPLQAQATELRVVDLDSVRPSELEGFFRLEHALWQEQLSWDVSAAVTAFRRALERGGVSGKAVRCGPSTAGYGYFIVEAGRGVMTGLAVAPEWSGKDVGPLLVRSMIGDLTLRGVTRIESQFVSFDASWLVPCFTAEAFETYLREFRRLPLNGQRPGNPGELPSARFALRTWRSWNLTEACQVMQSAHVPGVDARMNELYRSSEGCRSLLTSVLRHRGCGAAILEASTVAREPGTDRPAGFAVVTETSVRKAHLAQLAVDPEFQGRGLGRLLLTRTIERLAEMGYDGLSLMVSRENHRALDLYRSFGFDLVIAFPVFSRD